MTLIRALMVGAIAVAALASQNAQACSAARGSGTRCASPVVAPASEPAAPGELQVEAPEAQLDMAKKNGRSSAKRVQYDPSVINVNITGQAAKLVYLDLVGSAIYTTDFTEDNVTQLVGRNAVCYERRKSRSNGSVRKTYSCDINLRKGEALVGAAG